MIRNETDAWIALARTVGETPAAIIREMVETMADVDAVIVLRAPGESRPVPIERHRDFSPVDVGGPRTDETPATEPLRPGEKLIGGRRFYSADWL